MSKDALTGFLQNTNLISFRAANEITDQFANKVILKNQFQLTAGKLCNEYLFLEKGYMRAFAYDTVGKEVTTGFYSYGQVVFEVSSFFNRTRSKENIQAHTDCVSSTKNK